MEHNATQASQSSVRFDMFKLKDFPTFMSQIKRIVVTCAAF